MALLLIMAARNEIRKRDKKEAADDPRFYCNCGGGIDQYQLKVVILEI